MVDCRSLFIGLSERLELSEGTIFRDLQIRTQSLQEFRGLSGSGFRMGNLLGFLAMWVVLCSAVR